MQLRTTRKYLPVACLLLTALLAGCVSGGESADDTNTTERVSVTQDDGLTLTFQTIKQTYREGEPIVLELGLENTGKKMANGIEHELYGADFIAQQPPQFEGKSSLRPVDQSSNQPGEKTTVTWRVDNPVNLDAGRTETFPANVRVKYNYQTTATASFTAVSGRDHEGTGEPVTTRTTAGPLDVSVDINSPTPVYSSEDGPTKVSIPVIIRNKGDGEVAGINGESRDVQILSAEFPNTDRATLTCSRSTVSLFEGERRVPCTAQLPSEVFEQQFMMRINLGYDYFETQKTSFGVEGLEGDQSR